MSRQPADTSELRFSATPRGARLARRLASLRVHEWGHPYGSAVNDAVALIVAELSANAVTHGSAPARDALLRLTRSPGRLLVEVADTGDGQPPTGLAAPPSPEAETGRGLALVAALAEEWGVTPRDGAPGKTVWAVIGTVLP
ncbi:MULTISPECIES: ATP-binding protein [Streptomyces]|uniref:ATP-binding protein n=1 Tax=Streptomyces TaxID=1883 RepID=UPI001F29BFC0|nr:MULTISPECIES: ATP-binding protein [Streptomyces]